MTTPLASTASFRHSLALLGGALMLSLATIAPQACAQDVIPKSAKSYALVDALGDLRFDQPLAIASVPGEKHRLFVVEKSGCIQVVTGLDTGKLAKSIFLDLTDRRGEQRLDTGGECGALGLAFPADFAKTKRFYVYYSIAIEGSLYQRVSRFEVSADNANKADPQKEQPLWSQPDRANNHNGGDLHFGKDGYLYVSVGDGGAGDDQLNNGRFITKGFYSAILRMDVDKKPGNLPPNPHEGLTVDDKGEAYYSIPKDNPFVNATKYHGEAVDPKTVRTEMWATGLRNPWRFSIDPETGSVYVGDVGQNLWDEVDIAFSGADFGWSYREGKHPFTNGPGRDKEPEGFQPAAPIFEYPRSVGNSITGGVVYRGKTFTELAGKYIFADFNSGAVIALENLGKKWEPQQIGKEIGIAGIGIDPTNGDVLFANLGQGVIKRLKAQ